MTSTTTLCISHGEDADGLICATYMRLLKDAALILATYDELIDALKSVRPPVEEVYICDMNLRKDLIGEIERIRGFASMTLVDHHPTQEGILEQLREMGVTVIHDTRDCASVLLYDRYREELGRDAGRLAAYGAWADQFEDGPIATGLLREYDRQFTQLEALMLAYALTRDQTPEFRGPIVEGLSGLDYPHRISGVYETALAHLEEMAEIVEVLPKICERLNVMAYCETPDGKPIGTVAGLIVDAIGTKVGLCYVVKDDGRVNISLRSRRGLDYHLGEITREIAERVGGFGGGHKRASGASIPHSSLDQFIQGFADRL
ncbi:hypothetical protein E2P65_04695 [Candidatus Bathyarchaeota archaeon]|nr:hypothetical protein E2P65_04695 [Candidatus Bathyarchaeota archaeon]